MEDFTCGGIVEVGTIVSGGVEMGMFCSGGED